MLLLSAVAAVLKKIMKGEREKWQEHAEIFTGKAPKRKPPRDPLRLPVLSAARNC